MKRLSLVVLGAALLLVGCAQDEISPGSADPLPGDTSISTDGEQPESATVGADSDSNESTSDTDANPSPESTDDGASTNADPEPTTGDNAPTDPAPTTETDTSTDPAPATEDDAPPAGGSVSLGPDNATIAFVGAHKKEDPEPRNGRFEQFSGTAAVTDGNLTHVELQIDTTSIATDIDRLTNHLKSPDFFNVQEHPAASFTSTGIETGEGNQVTITGDLTLLGTTKSISIPATVSTDSGLSITAEFTIDRTEFGMTFGTDRVEEVVELTVTVNTSA